MIHRSLRGESRIPPLLFHPLLRQLGLQVVPALASCSLRVWIRSKSHRGPGAHVPTARLLLCLAFPRCPLTSTITSRRPSSTRNFPKSLLMVINLRLISTKAGQHILARGRTLFWSFRPQSSPRTGTHPHYSHLTGSFPVGV